MLLTPAEHDVTRMKHENSLETPEATFDSKHDYFSGFYRLLYDSLGWDPETDAAQDVSCLPSQQDVSCVPCKRIAASGLRAVVGCRLNTSPVI